MYCEICNDHSFFHPREFLCSMDQQLRVCMERLFSLLRTVCSHVMLLYIVHTYVHPKYTSTYDYQICYLSMYKRFPGLPRSYPTKSPSLAILPAAIPDDLRHDLAVAILEHLIDQPQILLIQAPSIHLQVLRAMVRDAHPRAHDNRAHARLIQHPPRSHRRDGHVAMARRNALQRPQQALEQPPAAPDTDHLEVFAKAGRHFGIECVRRLAIKPFRGKKAAALFPPALAGHGENYPPTFVESGEEQKEKRQTYQGAVSQELDTRFLTQSCHAVEGSLVYQRELYLIRDDGDVCVDDLLHSFRVEIA